MDPKKLSQLDPKLRDIYQHITENSSSQKKANSPTSTPEITSQFQSQPPTSAASTPTPSQSTSTTPAQPIAPSGQSDTASFQAEPEKPVNISTSNEIADFIPRSNDLTKKGKRKILIKLLLFGIVFIIFIAIYVIFWTKVFNLQVPFLP